MKGVHERNSCLRQVLIRSFTTNFKEDMIMLAHLLKKENKDLVAKINLLQNELNHLLESNISQVFQNASKKNRRKKLFFQEKIKIKIQNRIKQT